MKLQHGFKSSHLFLLFQLKVNSRGVIEVSDRIRVDTRAKKSTRVDIHAKKSTQVDTRAKLYP